MFYISISTPCSKQHNTGKTTLIKNIANYIRNAIKRNVKNVCNMFIAGLQSLHQCNILQYRATSDVVEDRRN